VCPSKGQRGILPALAGEGMPTGCILDVFAALRHEQIGRSIFVSELTETLVSV
jgi:hypothetical protein